MIDTLDIIAYSIIDAVRPILKKTDFIDIRDLRNWIKYERNELGKRRCSKNYPHIPQQFLQTEEVLLSTLPKFEKYPDITLVKSNNLPSFLTVSAGTPLIKSVSYKDYFIDKLEFIDNSNTLLSYINADRFDSQSIYTTWENGELVIGGKDSIFVGSLARVFITGVWENPEEVSTFNLETDRYPVSNDLLPVIANKITQDKYGINISYYYDDSNDEKHNLKPEAPKQ